MCYGLPVNVFKGKNQFRTPEQITGCPGHLVRYVFVPIVASITENAGNYLKEIFGIILSHDTSLHDEISRLQKFVDKSSISLYIYIIDQNKKIVHHLKPSTMQNSQHQHCSYLVVEKNSQSFYPFCVCDVNNKLHTIFSVDDANILKLFTGFSERQLLT
ncbi:unnamed protein product [Rotaria magnacalcarata]|uniref:Uncharacterized protein n=1 Tax=Rotaria magnacalcarata TaxID=392030 RepID=A0A820G0J1_9BILA|nr:unnamed protein product [Rotaria magnacalcarata]